MSLAVRIVLVFVSLLSTIEMMKKIRESKLQIEYAIFWIIFAGMILILAIFPELAFWGARILKIQSPINMIFLFIIFILLVKVFLMTIELSSLENKVKELVQKIALDEKARRDEEVKDDSKERTEQ